MSMEELRRKKIAYLMGTLSEVHTQIKQIEAVDGIEDMDMICCGLEDVFAMMEPLLGDMTQAQALARMT